MQSIILIFVILLYVMEHIDNLFNVISYLLNSSINEKDRNLELVMKYFRIHVDILGGKDEAYDMKNESLTNETKAKVFHVEEVTEDETKSKIQKSHEQPNTHFNEHERKHSETPVKKMTTKFVELKEKSTSNIFDILTCLFCDKDFTSNEIMRHDEETHLVDNLYKCPDCDFSLEMKKELLIHYAAEHKNLPYFHCQQCQEVFFDYILLREHMRGSHDIAVPNLSCPICLEPQSNKQNKPVLSHLELKHNSVKRMCKPCGKHFSTTDKLLTHQKKVHPVGGRKHKTCSVCGKIVLSESYSTHIATHKTERTVPCPNCGNLYFSRNNMLAHVNNVHADPKTLLKCTDCDYTAKCKKYLAEHQKKYHKDIDSQLQCDQCEKRFKTHLYLNEHLKTHTGIKDLPCNYCGKMFRRKSHRYRHELQHKGIFVATCLICDKNFRQKSNYKLHLKVHHPDNK